MASKLLVTLAVGGHYSRLWSDVAEAGWRAYAARHGYDVRMQSEPLDASARASSRSPSWQKCLVLSQEWSARYDRIVWVDADILINPVAPDISAGVPLDRVGAVSEYASPTRELSRQAFEREADYYRRRGVLTPGAGTPAEYYVAWGLPPVHDEVVQCGVLVLSPKHHKNLMEHVYRTYEDKGGAEWHYEMRPLSWEILTGGMAHWIDYRFNVGWQMTKLMHYPFLTAEPRKELVSRAKQKALRLIDGDHLERLARACATITYLNNYFLHFAACMSEMGLVNQSASSWADVRP